MSAEEIIPVFIRELGERLREVRHRQGLSLQEVDERSGREFKATVVAAYERGDRTISVPRLQRLAAFYGVSVDQVLPGGSNDPNRADTKGEPITLDLAKLKTLQFPEREVLCRYVNMIQAERGDFNGRVITIRNADIRLLAPLLGSDEISLRHRLDELGIIVEGSR